MQVLYNLEGLLSRPLAFVEYEYAEGEEADDCKLDAIPNFV